MTLQRLGQHKLLILDMDMTLVLPKDTAFYSQYGRKTEEAIAEHFSLSQSEAIDMANDHRSRFGGAEFALFNDNQTPPNYSVLYDKLAEIDPRGAFNDRSSIRRDLQVLRGAGVKIAVLTSTPERLARLIMEESGLDYRHDVDAFYAYQRDAGPQKIIHGKKAFADVMQDFGIAAKDALSIGDTIKYDIDPALSLGADAIAISDQHIDGYKTSLNLETVLKQLKRRP